MPLLFLLALAAQDWNEALRHEVREGRYLRAQELLADPLVDPDDQDDEGWTALMYAARSDTPELVTLLVHAGADLNLRNDDGETALIVAVRRGRVDAARLLLMAGADESVRDDRGRSALDWAEDRNRLYLAQIIRIASEPSAATVTVAERPVTIEDETLVPPRVVTENPPLYTERAFERRIEGRVALQVIVRKDGTVGPIRILESLDAELDQAAIDAVKTWEFEPARADDVPINVLTRVEIDFSLQRKKSMFLPGRGRTLAPRVVYRIR